VKSLPANHGFWPILEVSCVYIAIIHAHNIALLASKGGVMVFRISSSKLCSVAGVPAYTNTSGAIGKLAQKLLGVSHMMSKEEFVKKHCISFEEYTEVYGDLCKNRKIDIRKAFQQMIDGSYKGYVHRVKVFEPGRIF